MIKIDGYLVFLSINQRKALIFIMLNYTNFQEYFSYFQEIGNYVYKE